MKINGFLLNTISLLSVLALILAINYHPQLSSHFYLAGGSLNIGNEVISGKFNTFFLSSLGLTSAVILVAYLLIVRCETILSRVLMIIADILLIFITFAVTQERVLHNFISDTHVNEVAANSPESSAVIMGTSDTTMLTIILAHMVIMLIGVIRTYKSKENQIEDKASAYD